MSEGFQCFNLDVFMWPLTLFAPASSAFPLTFSLSNCLLPSRLPAPWRPTLPPAPTPTRPKEWTWPTASQTCGSKPRSTAWTRCPRSTESRRRRRRWTQVEGGGHSAPTVQHHLLDNCLLTTRPGSPDFSSSLLWGSLDNSAQWTPGHQDSGGGGGGGLHLIFSTWASLNFLYKEASANQMLQPDIDHFCAWDWTSELFLHFLRSLLETSVRTTWTTSLSPDCVGGSDQTPQIFLIWQRTDVYHAFFFFFYIFLHVIPLTCKHFDTFSCNSPV